MKTSITVFFVFVITFQLKAQNYNHDIGVFFGTSSLSSDYGESNSITDNLTNSSPSFAIAHYLQFYNKSLRWDRNRSSRVLNHIMVKSEIRYSNSSDLRNYTEASRGNTASAEQVRAMKGSLTVFNLGTNLEYYMFPLKTFKRTNRILINPFVSIGVNYSMYDRDITSEIAGARKEGNLLPKTYLGSEALFLGADESISFSAAAGTRIKIAANTDIITQFGYQYFLVDDLEGVNANVPQNTSNDWLINFQFGLVYHLNF